MKKMRRTARVALALATCAGLLLGGCAMNPAAGKAGDAPKEDGKQTVTFWQLKLSPQEDAWFTKQVKAYNASQDKITVNYQIVPGDVWDQKIKAAQAAGTAPDTYLLAYNRVASSAKIGSVLDLTDRVKPEAWSDLTDTARSMVTSDGKQYAYPLLLEPIAMLFYRADMYQEAGLDPAKPPTTWDQLISHGKALTNDKHFGLITAQDAGALSTVSWAQQLEVAGHYPISDDWSSAKADDPAYVPLLEFYAGLYQQGVLPKQALAGYNDPRPFCEGKAAQMVNGSWSAIMFLNDCPELTDKIKVAPMPTRTGEPGQMTTTLGGWSMVIDAKSKNPDATAEFIQWLAAGDPAVMESYFRDTQFSKYSPRTSVTEAIAADPESKSNPWNATIADQIVPDAGPEPTFDVGVSLAFSTAIEEAMKGKQPTQALAEAQKKITEVIRTQGLAGKGPGAAAQQ